MDVALLLLRARPREVGVYESDVGKRKAYLGYGAEGGICESGGVCWVEVV